MRNRLYTFRSVLTRTAALAVLLLLLVGVTAGHPVAAGLPALPNLPLPTLGGMQFWSDIEVHRGWRIQRNVLTGHGRLLDTDNVRQCWGGVESCRKRFERICAARGFGPDARHLVILLHGLGRTRNMFDGLQAGLADAGYRNVAVSWPSTRRSLARNADDLERLIENLEGVERVSFVTHSLGGLLVRELLSRQDAAWRKRVAVHAVVMTAPPSQGSRLADTLQYVPPVNLVLGPGLIAATSVRARALPAPDAPFAIIAGGRGDQGYNPLLAGDDDLVVAMAETRLDGAGAWRRVDSLHAFVPNHPDAVQATVAFLDRHRTGAP